nr:MAG TPA: hypothetical protein [Caudoviricetes sp.]
MFFSLFYILLVIVPGLCYNRGAAARRGCVVCGCSAFALAGYAVRPFLFSYY